jgi:NhaA family Na+:H+ antiporter
MPAPPVRRVVDPVVEFLRDEAAGGLVLLAATVVALVWANTPAREAYDSLWATNLRIGVGDIAIGEDLRHWVNDGLMALFFFVVGLEIKRELVAGELSDRRAAALPVLAAIGGVALPALLFTLIVGGGEGARGWAIPMATDIAFAVGVLALLGDRVSSGVKVVLLAIAVVDDIIAIAIIAVFYASDVQLGWLAAAGAGLALCVALRLAGVWRVTVYLPVGLFVWAATHESGVHATIAGVVLGLMTPTGRVRGRAVLESLEQRLHPLTSFVVVPLFALANAGVYLGGGALVDAAASRVAWAVAVGLVVGKLIGIGFASVVADRSGVAALPPGVGRRDVIGIAALGGIGFTVSLFITSLAFDSQVLQDEAKVGIFAGSILSALIGTSILRRPGRREPPARTP